ncbi:signal peptidase I [Psychromonas sp. Urea-02u-13]|uniref:signal peptidase I n=1 Tax=Psychromonas sp. Urea-02u-13 TaxID=2058326 RepID=UPI000C32D252|nr:signal peptidase I [Psychromonas sp. Urea-02u-13]PKG39411.1 signal peptidase I [Psychromonas sp. Urea-02u-13]
MANTFALILVILTFVTGIVWVIDKFKWGPARNAARQAAQDKAEIGLDEDTLAKIHPENVVIENARSLFPVIAVVFILRSFLYEPFQIPSGSMMPTLLIGDFILVEKFSYGVKEPIWQNTLIPVSLPKRGDVAVFKYPEDQRVDFIKRVIGLPGDRVVYKDKQLYLIPACEKAECGTYKALDMQSLGEQDFKDEAATMQVYSEVLGDVAHKIIVNPNRRDHTAYYYQQDDVKTYAYEWVVPKGNYFVMGDNRDNSKDSRYWGFVPEQNLVGKAVATWISFEFYRDVDGLLPTWVPSSVRFDRIGSIK